MVCVFIDKLNRLLSWAVIIFNALSHVTYVRRQTQNRVSWFSCWSFNLRNAEPEAFAVGGLFVDRPVTQGLFANKCRSIQYK